MNYCAPCRRHLNGALACPGCGAPATGPDRPSPPAPRVGAAAGPLPEPVGAAGPAAPGGGPGAG
ncbi:SCO2400 family protein, partial [Kitasatospora purpeofusca]